MLQTILLAAIAAVLLIGVGFYLGRLYTRREIGQGN